jgi:hypothetical protein
MIDQSTLRRRFTTRRFLDDDGARVLAGSCGSWLKTFRRRIVDSL